MYAPMVYLTMMTVSPLMINSTKSMIIMWISIEMMTISFIMTFSSQLMNMSNKFIMYFIIQTMGSIIFLYFLYKNTFNNMMDTYMINTNTLIMMSIFLKMGLFPLHFWIIKMNKILNWISTLMLLTWQKLIPILIFFKLYMYSNNMMIMIIMSIMVSTIMQYNIKTIKNIILISSMSHSAWIIISNNNYYYNLSYFIMYSYVLIMLMLTLNYHNLWNFFNKMNSKNLMMILLMLSLGSIPPTIGFIPKWSILDSMINLPMPNSMIIIMIINTTINFFIYSQLIFKLIFIKNNKKNIPMKKSMSFNKMKQLTIMAPIIFIFK